MTISLFVLTALVLALSAFKVKQMYIYKHCTKRQRGKEKREEKRRKRERERAKNVRK